MYKLFKKIGNSLTLVWQNFYLLSWKVSKRVDFSLGVDMRSTNCVCWRNWHKNHSSLFLSLSPPLYLSHYIGVNSKNKTWALVEALSDNLWTFGVQNSRGRQVPKFSTEFYYSLRLIHTTQFFFFSAFCQQRSVSLPLFCWWKIMRNRKTKMICLNSYSRCRWLWILSSEGPVMPICCIQVTIGCLNSHTFLALTIFLMTTKTHLECKVKDLLPV